MSVQERSWMSRTHKAMTDYKRPLVVYWLIALNAAVFLIGFAGMGKGVESLGYFSVSTAMNHGEIWRFISYQFLHANLGHIALNMMGLWVFGQVVEAELGHGKFLLYYLACGIAAALFYTLLGYMGIVNPGLELHGYNWTDIPLIGASGSIYGVIAACAVLHPHSRIQLIFPPINMSVRNFAIGILCVAAAIIAFNWNNAGGEAGHMGGMLAGFLIMCLIMIRRRFKAKPRLAHAKDFEEKSNAILNKVQTSGFDSLTDEEWNILRKASSLPPRKNPPHQG